MITFYVDMVILLVNNCLFTHSEDNQPITKYKSCIKLKLTTLQRNLNMFMVPNNPFSQPTC